ncbi:SEC14-like protein 2, partial [Orchesella cincta]
IHFVYDFSIPLTSGLVATQSNYQESILFLIPTKAQIKIPIKMIDTPEWITSEEKVLVDKFQARVQDVLPPAEIAKSTEDQDAYLLRWLRARDLNIDKAESMLLNALKWRKENDVDNALHAKMDPFFPENYRQKFVGPDRDGRPVAIGPFYEWDFRKLTANNKSAEEFTAFANNYFEEIMEKIRIQNENRKPGQAPVTQFIPICDIDQYSYGQMLNFTAMRKWFQMAATYEAYYPEVLYKAVFINCPSYFQFFIKLLKPIVAARTLEKFICYPSLDDWKKDVANYMDPSILPEQFGGTNQFNPFSNAPANGRNEPASVGNQ